MFCVEVPAGSSVEGLGIAQSRIGDALGVGVLGLRRGGELHLLPEREEILRGGDVLFVRGLRNEPIIVNDPIIARLRSTGEYGSLISDIREAVDSARESTREGIESSKEGS